jgi:hypothetical protein
MTEDARWIDGNALAGLLQEIFGDEMTDAPHTCQSCGNTRPIGAHRVFVGAGRVLRCPVCDGVALAAVTMRDHEMVHLGGRWRIALPH